MTIENLYHQILGIFLLLFLFRTTQQSKSRMTSTPHFDLHTQFAQFCNTVQNEHEAFNSRAPDQRFKKVVNRAPCSWILLMPWLYDAKVEMLSYTQPTLLVLRDFITESHAQKVVELVLRQDSLHSMTVNSGIEPRSIKRSRRNANGTWLSHHHSAHITAMSHAVARTLGCLVYNTTGHYVPHHDTMHEDTKTVKQRGNRQATLMVHLKKAEVGGYTAFLRIPTLIKSVRVGDALFWFNQHANDTTDDNSLHGGCPILSGTKIVATMWIRRHMQTWPCALRDDHPFVLDFPDFWEKNS